MSTLAAPLVTVYDPTKLSLSATASTATASTKTTNERKQGPQYAYFTRLDYSHTDLLAFLSGVTTKISHQHRGNVTDLIKGLEQNIVLQVLLLHKVGVLPGGLGDQQPPLNDRGMPGRERTVEKFARLSTECCIASRFCEKAHERLSQFVDTNRQQRQLPCRGADSDTRADSIDGLCLDCLHYVARLSGKRRDDAGSSLGRLR